MLRKIQNCSPHAQSRSRFSEAGALFGPPLLPPGGLVGSLIGLQMSTGFCVVVCVVTLVYQPMLPDVPASESVLATHAGSPEKSGPQCVSVFFGATRSCFVL